MELNHTIVPANDNVESAKFFARMMGLEAETPRGHFAPVKINDSLVFDFTGSSPQSKYALNCTNCEQFAAVAPHTHRRRPRASR